MSHQVILHPLARLAPHPPHAHRRHGQVYIAVTLVSSRLDYAYSVLFGTSASDINKIQ